MKGEKGRRKVPVNELKVGMCVRGLDRPLLDMPLWTDRFLIRSEREIEQLRALCEFVFIDSAQSAPVRPAPAARGGAKAIDRRVDALERELEVARPLYRRSQAVLDTLLDDIRLGRSIDGDKAKDLVKDMMESVIRNPDALVWLTNLKDKDKYTSMHSINTGVFALVFGRYIGLPAQQLYALGLGALLHDVGKVKVPSHILNKPGRLTPDEFKAMQRHPAYGRELLADLKDIPGAAVDIAYMHHERADGSGYPQKLRGRAIPLLARIVGMIDYYDAVTSARVYKDPSPPHQVVKELYSMRDVAFDGRMVDKFIRCVGIYPVGTLLELSSGEIGVVIAVEPSDLTRPVMRMVLDRDRRPCDPPRIWRLSAPDQGVAGPPPTVARVLDPGEYDIDVASLCG